MNNVNRLRTDLFIVLNQMLGLAITNTGVLGVYGICGSIIPVYSYAKQQGYSLISTISEVNDFYEKHCNVAYSQWNKFTGDFLYPVPSDDPEESHQVIYMFRNNKWDTNTQYGRDRIELLQHMISYFSKGSNFINSDTQGE